MNGTNITTLVAMTRTQTTALRCSTLLVVIFYTLSVIIEYTGNLSMTFLSPFWYFNAPAMINRGFSGLNISLTVLIILVSLWGMYANYDKRDLYG